MTRDRDRDGRRTGAPWWLVVLAVLAPLALAAPAAADCAGPELAPPPAPVHAGDVLEIEGAGFTAECNDTSVGCLPPRRSPPMRAVEVELRDGRVVIARTSADAGDGYGLRTELVLPEDLAPGRYELVAVPREGGWGPTEPVPVEVVP